MLEEPIKSRTEIQKEKKKSVWYTESVHQIIARSTKSQTEIQEKKKKSVQRTGTRRISASDHCEKHKIPD